MDSPGPRGSGACSRKILNSGRLFEKAWAPLLRDLRARSWISDEDLALWHSRPVGSALRWVVRKRAPRPESGA